jgi:hypothetical protein
MDARTDFRFGRDRRYAGGLILIKTGTAKEWRMWCGTRRRFIIKQV